MNKIGEHDLLYLTFDFFSKKIELSSRNDCATILCVRVKESICPSICIFIPFHKNEIVITNGLCALSTHKLIWFRLLFFILLYIALALCLRGLVQWTCYAYANYTRTVIIKWVRKSSLFFHFDIFKCNVLFDKQCC